MSQFLPRRWRRRETLIPLVSGLLIVSAFLLTRLAGQWNPKLLNIWLFAAPGHGHAASQGFTVADLLMLLAALVAGWPIATQAVRALAVRYIGIDLLVTVAMVGAILIGNFWEAAAVTFLFALGHALEVATLNKTRSALTELVAVVPNQATLLTSEGPKEVPAHRVQMGQTVLVKAGEKVPVDGEVTAGNAAIDQATITGESIPAEKRPGDLVFAGTISVSGLLEVQATGVGSETTIARIIRRVEDAQDAKAPTQSLIDRISRWYTPAVMVVALIAGLATRDVVLALTLLVIACPGALVISIPVAVVAGIGRGARDGILIKGGEFLESAAKINAVALDKTGTLTQNRPAVTQIVPLIEDVSSTELLGAAARAEAGSSHPLSKAVTEAATQAGVVLTQTPERVETVPGQGIIADIEGGRTLVGNAALFQHRGLHHDQVEAVTDDVTARGMTPMIVAVERRVLGLIAVMDQIRPVAARMVRELREEGVNLVVILSGDSQRVVSVVGEQVGADQAIGGLMPEGKLEAIADIQARGYTVAMVGDGVNDTPALAAANVGVAMGAAGSAVALETADIALMADDLLKLPQAIRLAKRTRRVMVQNMWIAFLTVAVLLAGVFGGAVTMALGMAVHEVSVLVVILNAMRLLRNRPEDHA